MEPFKNLLNADGVRAAGLKLQQVQPDFDARGFTRLATRGLDTLEMKARAHHICAALETTLPDDFGAAADLLEATMAAPNVGEWTDTSALGDPSGPARTAHDDGLRGWILWPVGEFIARRGLQQPQRALQALHALTQRFTAEWAIRPFIVEHPALTFGTLHAWCQDPSDHVRRLVSEGSRPRLPWGLRLQSLVQDPAPTLPLLRALQDDPSDYVRRSMANHLNDIAKDHPALVCGWVEEHLPLATPARRALLRHACRSLIKQGDLRALHAFGLGAALRGQVSLRVSPARVPVGEHITLTLQLRSTSARAQVLAVDYAVHHVKANGSISAKVFKGWQLELPARAELTLTKRHSMKRVTTRRYFAGVHRVTVQVNGREVGDATFDLLIS